MSQSELLAVPQSATTAPLATHTSDVPSALVNVNDGYSGLLRMSFLWRSVRLTILVVAGCFAAVCGAFFIHFLIIAGVFDGPFYNPYESADICFSSDTPGATSRYVEYTFVTCSTRVPLSEPIGADQAVLRFEDTDHDGRPEAVVESSRYKCRFGGQGCYGAYRFVLKICSECAQKVTLLSEQNLPDLEWRVTSAL